MIVFDPQREREILRGDVGFEFYLSKTVEKAIEAGAVGFGARNRLSVAVQCLLTGLDEPADRLLECARDWALKAIELNEGKGRSDAGYDIYRRFQVLALCNWLLTGRDDPEHQGMAIDGLESHYLSQSATSTDRVSASLSASSYVDAKAWAQADARLTAASILPPAKLSGLRTEGGLGKIYCGHHLRGEYTEEEVAQATERGLKMWMNQLLTRGGDIRAAQWLKIAHWRPDGSLTPRETLLKAYDYLPGVSPP